MTLREKNYRNARAEVAERLREVKDLLLDAQQAMDDTHPKDAWECLNNAKNQLEGAMVTAKWSQSLFPEEP